MSEGQFSSSNGDSAEAERLCPACGSATFASLFALAPTFDASRLQLRDYELRRCGDCLTYYTSPELPAVDLATLYQDSTQFSEFEDLKDDQKAQPILDYYKAIIHRIIASAPWGSARLNFFEIGAGPAWVARAIRNLRINASTFAQDLSSECAHSCPWVDTYHVGTIETSPFDQVHLASMTHVIEHLVRPVVDMPAIRKRMRNDGVLLVTAPYRPIAWRDDRPVAKEWYDWSYNHVPGHVQFFSREGLAALSERTGFQLVHWDTSPDSGQAFEALLLAK